ncbi:MAG: glycosyltransferase family 2 protein [Lactobacillaceae bacterium]|nr:glycosyltransferase family 2 protein [Lactobacillaceae bacterium]
MTKQSRVAAVVVTFNRLDFLKKCINHLLSQTILPAEILIIDNASTDDTQREITALAQQNELINYQRLEKNVGGAGGFNYGIKAAFTNPIIDDVWLMDDDTMPRPETLEKLLEAENKLDHKFGFLVSNARWAKNGHAALMNVPETTAGWNDLAENGLIGLKTGTFVSFLTSRAVVEKVGLPIKEFFIWSDDLEFSSRISKKYPGYFVIDSLVDHDMAKNQSVQFLQENDPNRLGRYYYSFRNKLYIEHRDGHRGYLRYKISLLSLIFSLPFKRISYKGKKEKILIRGFFSGLRFRPKVEFLKNK